MKIAGRIETPAAVAKHMAMVADNQIPVRLFADEGKLIAKGFLFFDADSGEPLRFSPTPPDWSAHSSLTAHYVFEDRSSVFKTTPLRAVHPHLHLSLPEGVVLFDRRVHFRVPPDPAMPVRIRLRVPELPEILLSARDISRGGFSVLVPRRIAAFEKNRTCPVTVELPGVGAVRLAATVKGVFPFLKVMRVGWAFAFQDKDMAACERILAYCLSRLDALKRSGGTPSGHDNEKRARICLIDTEAAAEEYAFLKRLFVLEQVGYMEALSRLRRRAPDLVVVNTRPAGANLILQSLSRDARFSELPLVLLGRGGKIKPRPGAVATVRTPYKQAFLIKTMTTVLEQNRLSLAVDRSYYRCFSGEGKKITLVDPNRNIPRCEMKVLEACGFCLHWVCDRTGIMTAIEAMAPDLLILDNDTGDIDPASLCRLINLNKSIKHIPKIRLIQGPGPVSTRLLSDAGLFFLSRPFDADQLLGTVHHALGHPL